MLWDFESDSDLTCFDHLASNIPDSIREAAKRELKIRGYGKETIQREEWKRTD